MEHIRIVRWLIFVLLIASAQVIFSQQIATALTPGKAAKGEEANAYDPLGRDTPRGTLYGFVRATRREDYAKAAQYLQTTAGKSSETNARELQELMDLGFKGNLDFIRDKPEGNVDDGLSLDRDRLGTIEVADQAVDLIVVRVQDSTSKRMIWLISAETLAESESVYTKMQPPLLARHLPEVLTTNYFLSISAAQWIGWLVSLPLAYFIAWAVVLIIRMFNRILPEKRRAKDPSFTTLRTPSRFVCFVVAHGYFVYVLGLPVLYRWYYLHFLLAVFFAAAFWLISRCVSVFFVRAVGKLGAWTIERASMIAMVDRIIRVCIFIVAVIIIAATLGFDTKAMLAGAGIGGLAIALAGQKTLENVIGGVSLLLDRAVHVGDTCRIGDKLGKVEDIGLRSLRLRMLDQTVVVVPNGVLAQVQFENLTSRTKLLIQNRFCVRSETPVRKLQGMLDALQQMLDNLSYIERGTSRVRLVRFTGAATEVELFAYVLTSDWADFTMFRQDVMVKVLEIVEAEGIGLAGTTQLSYVEVSSQAYR